MRLEAAIVLKAKELWDEHQPFPRDPAQRDRPSVLPESPICKACDLAGWPCDAVQLASLILHDKEVGAVMPGSATSWAWRFDR